MDLYEIKRLTAKEMKEYLARLIEVVGRLGDVLVSLEEEREELLATKEMLIKALQIEREVDRRVKKQVRSEDTEEWNTIMKELT